MPFDAGLLQRLRANNVFAPPPMAPMGIEQPQPDLMNMQQPLGPMSVNQPPPQMNNSALPPMAPAPMQQNQSDHNATDMYDEAIRNMPEREKPGILRKIAASMVALGREGSQGADRVLNAPYEEKMEDWNQKIKALQPGMQMEKQGRINERLITADNTRARQTDERIRQGERKIEDAATKSQQIYETQQADMERKINEAQQRIDLAERALTQRGDDANARIDLGKATLDATNARHELTMAQREAEAEEAKRLHDAQIAKLNEELENLRNPKPVTETTELNADGTKKTVITQKGPIKAAPLTKTQTNKKTGQKRTLLSTDGGKTWTVKP